MTPIQAVFDSEILFDPAEELERFLARVPARWVVYLLADAEDRPIQLLCVRNLRQSLKRRLGADEQVGPSRRVNYRDLVRRIHWRRVDSAFEADWLYYEAARKLFPQSYQGMVGFRPAWFVHMDPDAAFPRYVKTIDLSSKPGVFLGPLEDKHAAARLIELVEDLFELCRYHHILTEAPHGRACAYKEMGKCPAPCDGSINMEQYRRMIECSAQVLVDPRDHLCEQTRRMESAAAELRFETAAKIKARLAQMSQLGKGPFRHVRRAQDFQLISLQRGPRDGTARLFLITPGEIEEVAGLIADPMQASDLLRVVLDLAWGARVAVDSTGAERIGIVSHHLFLTKQTSGVFLRLDTLDDKTLAKAFRELQKQKVKETGDEEGLVKELQAL